MAILDKLTQELFLRRFHEKGEAALPFLCESRVSQLCFLSAYKNLEPMDKNERKSLKVYVNVMFPDKPARFRVNAMRIIYTIGTLL